MTPKSQKSPARPRFRRLRVDDVTVVDKPTLRRAVSGTVVGNTMEWYDVGIYGYLAVTMGAVFLPTAAPALQVLFSLGVFAATYIARPLGGIIFGHLGDKLGRQKVLATTLILMAIATFGIGLLPDFAAIGPAAPVLLVALKLVQGFSTGGEYAGATTFISEYSPDAKRGIFASFLDAGSYIGFALGAAVVTFLQFTMGQEAMLEGGWRIPFLIAGPMGAVAIWIRLKVEESPAFKAAQDAQEAQDEHVADIEGRPKNTVALIRRHWRPILIAIGLVAASNTVGYALTSYMPTYLTDALGYDPLNGTLLTIPVLVLLAALLPAVGKLSDRIGRRTVMFIGAATVVVLAVPAFMLLGVGTIWTTLGGLSLMAVMVALWIANQAASLPSLFPTSARYGGMGIAFNISIALFGGMTPLIVQALLLWTGNDLSPAFFLIATSLLGAVALLFMKESSQKPMPGSPPSVETIEQARELVENQDTNPNLDLSQMPLLLARREELAGAR